MPLFRANLVTTAILGTHASDTTAVHGITDTLNLNSIIAGNGAEPTRLVIAGDPDSEQSSVASGSGGTINVRGGDGGFPDISGGTGGNAGSIDLAGATGNGGNGNGGNGGSITLRGTFDTGDAGSINLSGGTNGASNGGSIISIGGSDFDGGTLNMSGGIDGAGGSINTSNGGGSINTSQSGGSINTSQSGGSISTDENGGFIRTAGDGGGYIDTSVGGDGDAGGYINTSGGDDGGGVGGYIRTTGGDAGTNGGYINTSAGNYSDNGAGGFIDTSGGDGADGCIGGYIKTSGGTAAGQDGGAIDTSNGGGNIVTNGTGSIGLGVSGTRTTITGTASGSNKTVSFPNNSGVVLLARSLSVAITFGSCAGNGAVTASSQTVSGAAVGDAVLVTCTTDRTTLTAGGTSNIIFDGVVTATNTVSVRAHNPNASAITLGSLNIIIIVIKL